MNPADVSELFAPPDFLPTTFGTFTFGGACAITRLTFEPEVALVPPAGFWLSTVPGATVVELWLLVETVNPADFRLEVAAACVSPVTSGTLTFGFPEEMNSVTAPFTGNDDPACGSVRVACPAGTASEVSD